MAMGAMEKSGTLEVLFLAATNGVPRWQGSVLAWLSRVKSDSDFLGRRCVEGPRAPTLRESITHKQPIEARPGNTNL